MRMLRGNANKVYFLLVLTTLLVVIPIAYQGNGENLATLELEHSSLQAANSSTETFTEEPFQVLIFSEGSEGEKEPRSSTMMLAQFDPSDGETRIVSLLSDSYVSIPAIKMIRSVLSTISGVLIY
ncbi:hypothetical protein [Geomicrobium sp. JCM 19039]|uniref:hypothetical protein n=1 Tax=Geomicrobium sp. JCM 19039 TaxID=1460636 RepID=UPI00045F3812|nr:hypothetical protein [Geomicrobium sp. JCM 19039]GAK11847.1 hypothetical protein JCM19039_1567 [Geomicrobium sp. JCM 19039]